MQNQSKTSLPVIGILDVNSSSVIPMTKYISYYSPKEYFEQNKSVTQMGVLIVKFECHPLKMIITTTLLLEPFGKYNENYNKKQKIIKLAR